MWLSARRFSQQTFARCPDTLGGALSVRLPGAAEATIESLYATCSEDGALWMNVHLLAGVASRRTRRCLRRGYDDGFDRG